MLQCLLLSTACNAIRILSSHHVFPGRLGVYHRVGELIPRQDALDLERRALALPLGAWETDRHVSFPTRDVPVEVVCDDFEDAVWARRLRPALAAAYGLDEAALSLEDCFVARYDAAPDGAGADRLSPHRDSSLLSFNVLLSDAAAFDGGATVFDDDDGDDVMDAADAGDGVLHPGQLLHRGRRTTRGTRVLIVGFVGVDDGARRRRAGAPPAAGATGRVAQLRRVRRRLRREGRHRAAAAAALRAALDDDVREVRALAANREDQGPGDGEGRRRAVAVVDGGAAARVSALLDAEAAGADVDADGFATRLLVRRADKRFDLRLDDPKTDGDGAWRRLAGAVAALAEDLLPGGGPRPPATVGVVVSRPGSDAQLWHGDGNQADFWNIFIPLCDVDAALGPTEFALGSHDDAHAATRAPTLDWDDTYVKVAPTLRRGDVVLFGYDMVHRGRPNAGEIDRPVFYATLAPPGATDDANF
ncbi:prolyl 4-hydroxylase alpha subunit [Aureococcus anophagefferens]|uniref:Prolyl 4-hydroxylase alpha subunit n=1 Tax=Aureococcus anophagefferens TaxID=44056 RepID=A0ABR1FYT0_AURAN